MSTTQQDMVLLTPTKRLFKTSTLETHSIKILIHEDKTYYGADSLLGMIGYTTDPRGKVSGLYNAASPLSKVGTTLSKKEILWDKDSVMEFLSYVENQPRLKNKRTNCWKIQELLEKDFKPSKSIEEEVDDNFSFDDWESGELPVIGDTCEYLHEEGKEWRWCKIKFMGDCMSIVETKTTSEVVLGLKQVDFRPIGCDRQIAVKTMMGFYESGMAVDKFCEALYFDGYRQVVK